METCFVVASVWTDDTILIFLASGIVCKKMARVGGFPKHTGALVPLIEQKIVCQLQRADSAFWILLVWCKNPVFVVGGAKTDCAGQTVFAGGLGGNSLFFFKLHGNYAD